MMLRRVVPVGLGRLARLAIAPSKLKGRASKSKGGMTVDATDGAVSKWVE